MRSVAFPVLELSMSDVMTVQWRYYHCDVTLLRTHRQADRIEWTHDLRRDTNANVYDRLPGLCDKCRTAPGGRRRVDQAHYNMSQ